MKPTLLFIVVGTLSLFSLQRAAAGANCSDISTIVTVADVNTCLHSANDLESWKQIWGIDFNPRFTSLRNEEHDPIFIESSFLPGTLVVSKLALKNLGYGAYDESPLYWAEKNGQRILLVSSEKIGEAYRGRWFFAEECLKAVESEMAAREAELAETQAGYERTIRDKAAIDLMELPEVQKLRGWPKQFERKRSDIDIQRRQIARFRGLKGALDRVTEKLKALTLHSGPIARVGPTLTLLFEDRVRF